MVILKKVNELLEHVKLVESETIDLSRESMLRLDRFMEKNNLELDDDAVEAMQYQDIIAQQLSATIEAIESIQKNIMKFEHAFKEDENIVEESLDKLDSKFAQAIANAREKRDRFSGKILHSEDDGIEFF